MPSVDVFCRLGAAAGSTSVGGMSGYSASKLGQAAAIGEGVWLAAEALAAVAQRCFRSAPRPRGATVRPGPATPVWLALVAEVRPHLRRYGAKVLLARELGLDPSRITEFFVRRSAMPDAERTLMLLEWLGRQRRAIVRPGQFAPPAGGKPHAPAATPAPRR